MKYLMDTGFWYVSIVETDEHHETVAQATSKIRETVYLPIPVITETAYLVLRNQGVEALAHFLENLAVTKFQIEVPTSENYKRAAEIIRKYNDANIDFVDAVIVAIAERLNITKIFNS